MQQPACLVLGGRMARTHTDDDTPTPAGLHYALAAVHVLYTHAFSS